METITPQPTPRTSGTDFALRSQTMTYADRRHRSPTSRARMDLYTVWSGRTRSNAQCLSKVRALRRGTQAWDHAAIGSSEKIPLAL